MPIITTASRSFSLLVLALSLPALACGSDDDSDPMPGSAARDPDAAVEALVDRFSAAAGMLQVRSASNGLPAAGAPVDFDREPFITHGLGPSGERVAYYNFDVKSEEPAPLYVLVRDGESDPVAGQLDIVDVKPGDAGYNDFWQVTRVRVPADYEANSVASLDEIIDAGYPMSTTAELVNRPLVPKGSTAVQRLGDASNELQRAWYKGELVYSFSFDEGVLSGSSVPLAPIYVSFNVNPNLDGGGPASGFKMEVDSEQTHNVVSALPDQPGYSPLWAVSPYDNADFDRVDDLSSLDDANVLANGVATVNCPIVAIAE
ncbi:MAG TPA: hypothetical protein VMG12_45675 [Polyangiaceae bacterium]|nr:hypothetical protein [Polyangiaceae bacterium]